MKEDLLHYIWQFQQLNTIVLTTVQGQRLKVISPGFLNTHAGPDFLQAHILIDDVVYKGDIEIHINSSNWYHHCHHQNSAYDKVILHIVWSYNKPVVLKGHRVLPTLELQRYLTMEDIKKYEHLSEIRPLLPCAQQLHRIDLATWDSMLQRALHDRLEEKAKRLCVLLKANKNDSEATTYQLLAQNFGFKVNSATFFQLGQVLPFNIVQKNRPSLLNIEALLLGQAGLLPCDDLKDKKGYDPYIQSLIESYSYLKHKYRLTTPLTYTSWKFFRLRPSNSPFIRIAQFAKLLHLHPSIFYFLINTPPEKLCEGLSVQQSAYWQAHYQLGKSSKRKMLSLGKTSVYNIIINTIVPLLVAYGKNRNINHYTARALTILRYLPAEKNKITRLWKHLGMPIENAFQSQASIQLFNRFCTPKKCLACSIGQCILGRKAKYISPKRAGE